MSSREELVWLDEDINSKKLEMYGQRYITSKGKLLRRMGDVIKNLERRAGDPKESDEWRAYFKSKGAFLKSFQDKINSTPLFERLEDWWRYSFSICGREAVLYLTHTALVEIAGEEDNEYLGRPDEDAEFRLISMKAPVMTAEEFAKARHVASPTIRVWVRRGKLRSAFKLGNTWMIPELTEPMERGHSDARYRNSVPVNDVPAHFEGLKLNQPGEIFIRQLSDDKGKYEVLRYAEDDLTIADYTVPASEAEKLEAFLIAHPLFVYMGDEEICD